MIVDNINKITTGLRVLVVPLDWGLGHATRCIPIINALISDNIEVILAGEGDTVKILAKAYPKLVILPLRGYRVHYSRNRAFFFLKMLLQLPKIALAIKHEKRWLKKTIITHKINAVISDNRFGLQHKSIPAVFMTHQLQIETGKKWLDTFAQKINYHFINKFNECWIPDLPGRQHLAGKLSHPAKLPGVPVIYLGILSRFKKITTEKKYNLLIMLSGPEPQRSIFENMILSQLKEYTGTAVLVRGLPGSEKKLEIPNEKLTIQNHLHANALNELILQSENIVARSGYSTVMDLFTLKQKAILVPTPGQTEQEYLATYLMEKKIFFTCPQQNFSLQHALQSVNSFDFSFPAAITGLHIAVIQQWVEKINKRIRV
ncbi:glycosyltransferase [soil metagenome]